MTCYQPGRSKTLSERGCIGFTFSPSNCFYWGAAAPQTPCSSWGASSPPDPLAGGLQPPVPPCIPRGSASRALRFFLVPRSWKPLTCGYVAAGFFFLKIALFFLEAPNLWVGGLIKNIFCGPSRGSWKSLPEIVSKRAR